MEFITTNIKDLIVIKPKEINDERGFFIETYKESIFKHNNIHTKFVQDNHSSSKYGVLRGLHYQLNPKPQVKLVRCIQGEIFDVAVDLRKNSSTYLQWAGYILSEQNKHILYIPDGFAHGFLALSPVAQIMYKVSGEYDAKLDRGIIYNDPQINIQWPQINGNYILSTKDLNLPQVTAAENNFSE
ncbi:MAG: dTDP-4-dehydrorhamnose 3,5-epimerase [Burkholderiales bacterium]|nr:dTDP-4-dehydrorhamnose 3,5-epimerase [Burkholderiales bacterium]